MDVKDYLGYIAYFVSNIDQTASRIEYVRFFKQQLGDKMFASLPSKISVLSRRLYAAYVASSFTCYSAFYLASKLTFNDLVSLTGAITSLYNEWGIYYDTIDDDLSTSNVDSHIKKRALTTYKSILVQYESENVKVAKTKTVAKRTAAKTTRAKVAKSSSVSSAKSKSAKTVKAKAKSKVAKAKITKKVPSKIKKVVVKANSPKKKTVITVPKRSSAPKMKR
jgi:hypothetical protein